LGENIARQIAAHTKIAMSFGSSNRKPLSGRHRNLLVLAVILLFIGAVNYWLFQPYIALFPKGTQPVIVLVRDSFTARFLAGYFPDILWCCALVLATVVLSERKHLHLRGRLLILLLPFATEIAQSAGIINGVFDWFDIAVYGAVEAVSVILFPTLLSARYEK
jgi:hypothetical protein